MSIREILVNLCDTLRYEDEGEHYEYPDIKVEVDQALLALKDELMGMVNDEIDERISLWKSHGTEAPLAGIYSHLTLTGELEVIRSQIIAAINKLCEEK